MKLKLVDYMLIITSLLVLFQFMNSVTIVGNDDVRNVNRGDLPFYSGSSDSSASRASAYNALKAKILSMNIPDKNYNCPQSFINKYPEVEIPKNLPKRNFRGMKGEDKFFYQHFFHHKKTPGIYIEIGAVDGVGLSNTFVFDKKLNWTGVLIEPQTDNYIKLEQNREKPDVFTLHAAVCPVPGTIRIVGKGGQAFAADRGKSVALCEPMSSLLSRTTIDHVDLYSIDVEGKELDIILTHDFNKVPAFGVIVEARPVDRKTNIHVRNALYNAGFCRFAEEVGHHNEVWVNTSFPLETTSESHSARIF